MIIKMSSLKQIGEVPNEQSELHNYDEYVYIFIDIF